MLPLNQLIKLPKSSLLPTAFQPGSCFSVGANTSLLSNKVHKITYVLSSFRKTRLHGNHPTKATAQNKSLGLYTPVAILFVHSQRMCARVLPYQEGPGRNRKLGKA